MKITYKLHAPHLLACPSTSTIRTQLRVRMCLCCAHMCNMNMYQTRFYPYIYRLSYFPFDPTSNFTLGFVSLNFKMDYTISMRTVRVVEFCGKKEVGVKQSICSFLLS